MSFDYKKCNEGDHKVNLKSIFLALLRAQSAFSQSPLSLVQELSIVPFQNVNIDEFPVSSPFIMTSLEDCVEEAAAKEVTEDEDTEISSLSFGAGLGLLAAFMPYVARKIDPITRQYFSGAQSKYTLFVECSILGVHAVYAMGFLIALGIHFAGGDNGGVVDRTLKLLQERLNKGKLLEDFWNILKFEAGVQVGLLAPFEKALLERLGGRIMRSAQIALEGIHERQLIRENANALADLLPKELAKLTLDHVFDCAAADPDGLKRTSPAQEKEEVEEFFHRQALTSQYSVARRVVTSVTEVFNECRKIRRDLAH